VIYVFEDYELDTQRYELRRRGVLCSLEPQGFNVLVYLVQHRDRVVSKDELFAQLWPNQTVSESTLTQRLLAARRTLGDSGQSQHFIKTVHGGGIASSQSSKQSLTMPPCLMSPELLRL
jgi:DNA-binding winged helix-turn-helix (wHTH) protein